jgi:hypothetical protein
VVEIGDGVDVPVAERAAAVPDAVDALGLVDEAGEALPELAG